MFTELSYFCQALNKSFFFNFQDLVVRVRTNMKIKITIIVCTIIISLSKSCVIDENRRAKKLATKTPYEYVHSNHKSIKFPDENCKPSKFWLISRHGTRYPSKKGVEALINMIPEILNKIDLGQTELCDKDLELLKPYCEQLTHFKNAHFINMKKRDLLE